MNKPDVTAFFDEASNAVSYVVADGDSRCAAIIDAVLDFDVASGRTATHAAERIVRHVRERELTVDWILETHVHADHLTAAAYLQQALGGEIAIGARVTAVQETFGRIFNLRELVADGSQFDRLFGDGDRFAIGGLEARVMATPGHTPACVTYLIGDAAFVGDTLFMPDYGTARADFPGGDAGTLYDSIMRILSLPDETRLFMCHDYKAPGREAYAWETSVAEQRAHNVHVGGGRSVDEFVEFRESRDAKLSMPKLILPSLQVNLVGGRLPEPEDNGIRYLKLPIDAL